MTIKAQLQQGASDWLKITGEQVTYNAREKGQSYLIYATLEKDTSTIDDQGMIVLGQTLSFASSDVPNPRRCDTVVLPSGERYNVDEILDSPGYLTRVFVSPE